MYRIIFIVVILVASSNTLTYPTFYYILLWWCRLPRIELQSLLWHVPEFNPSEFACMTFSFLKTTIVINRNSLKRYGIMWTTVGARISSCCYVPICMINWLNTYLPNTPLFHNGMQTMIVRGLGMTTSELLLSILLQKRSDNRPTKELYPKLVSYRYSYKRDNKLRYI